MSQRSSGPAGPGSDEWLSAISGLKAGDQVSAQISEDNGTPTVVAIQYPAQLPSGGVPGG
jgi:hypothetical protein